MRITTTMLLLFAAGVARAEDKVELTPKYKKGEKFVQTERFTLKMHSKEVSENADSKTICEYTVLESTAAGAPTRVQRLYKTDEMDTSVRLGARNASKHDVEKYVGIPIVYERTPEGIQIRGDPPGKAELQKDLTMGCGSDGLLPDHPVARGDRWYPRGDPFASIPDATTGKRGKITCIFEGMTRWKGHVVAKVGLHYNSTRKGSDSGIWEHKGVFYFDPEWGKILWLETRAQYHPDRQGKAAIRGECVFQEAVTRG